MTTLTEARPTAERADIDSDLTHIVCCNPNKGLCGQDLRNAEDTDERADCVVCIDMLAEPCSRLCYVRTWLKWHLRWRWSR